jgi:hypothetical protein
MKRQRAGTPQTDDSTDQPREANEPTQKVLDSGIPELIAAVRSRKASPRDAGFVAGPPEVYRNKLLNRWRRGKDQALEDSIRIVLGGTVEGLLSLPRRHAEGLEMFLTTVKHWDALAAADPNPLLMKGAGAWV